MAERPAEAGTPLVADYRAKGLIVGSLDVDELLVQRLSGRTTCDKTQKPFTGMQPGTPCPDACGGTLIRRKDDDPEAIRNRLTVYHAQTKPVLDWYVAQRANVQHIDAVGTFDAVTARALKAVGR